MYFINNKIFSFYVKFNFLKLPKIIVKLNHNGKFGRKSVTKIETYTSNFIGEFKTINKFNIVLKNALGNNF